MQSLKQKVIDRIVFVVVIVVVIVGDVLENIHYRSQY